MERGPPPVLVIGAGRLGQGLALALTEAGGRVALVSRRQDPVVPPLTLAASRAEEARLAKLILLAVPDEGVAPVAEELAREELVGSSQVVLHLSGLLDRSALAALAGSGAGLGSFHPLQTVAEPATAPERLRGAYAGIEGDQRALAAGERLAGTLGMRAVRLEPGAKPAYHAGAAIVANYTVTLLGLAERLAVAAGLTPELAARIYLPLLEGTVRNLEALGPVGALTGPVRRGDVRTIEAHLAVLGTEEREVYRRLGLVALELARRAGLDDQAAERVAAALRGD